MVIKALHPKKGFTIVELLIVVVVIAILATITIVSYNGIKTSTQAAAVSTGVRQIEKSMRLWATDTGMTEWPTGDVVGGGTPFSTLIANNPNLKAYLQNTPAVEGVQTSEWFYDNDGDTKTQCGNSYNGTNIVIRYVSNRQVAQKVDDTLDDGNLNCGNVRYTDERIFYSLSYTRDIR